MNDYKAEAKNIQRLSKDIASHLDKAVITTDNNNGVLAYQSAVKDFTTARQLLKQIKARLDEYVPTKEVKPATRRSRRKPAPTENKVGSDGA